MIGPLTPEELEKELERELAAREAVHRKAVRANVSPDQTPDPADPQSEEGANPPAPTGHPLEIPESYLGDQCRAFARDPYWVHAYWRISADSSSRARRELADPTARRILRVHSQPIELRRLETAQPPGFFDIEVGDEPDNWYIHVGIPERTYRVDVGLIAGNGLFYPLAVSNRVTTPPDKMSDQVDPRWKSTDQEARDLYDLSGGSPVAQISHDPPARKHPSPRNRETNPRGLPESEIAGGGEGDSPTVALRETESISDDLAFIVDEEPSANGHSDPVRQGVMTPNPSGSVAAPAESASRPARQGRQSLGFVDAAASDRKTPPSDSWGASEARPAPPQENAGEFWFVLHTEVIVSGATEPDSIVTIQGTPVRLRPDGTFSVRFQLPDGEQTIPVVAVSRDGSHTRWITPKITRETTRREYGRHPASAAGPHEEAGGSDVTE